MSKRKYRISRRLAPVGADGMARIRDIADSGYAKVNEVMVDSFSASAIVSVFDGLNAANQDRMLQMPVWRVSEISFRLINKARSK